MKCLLVASTVLLAVSLSSSAALAAPTADAPQAEVEPMKIPHVSYHSDRAQRAFFPLQRSMLNEAQALEKAGKIQEALDRYKDAHDLLPLSDATLELAFAQARAGLFLPAARNIQEVLTSASVRDYNLHDIAEVREVFAYVKKHIGTVNVRLNILGARLTMDGEEVRDWPLHEEIYVEPGKHFIKAIADGYWLNQTSFEVKAGERKELPLAMQQRVHSQYIGFPARPVVFNLNANMAGKEEPPTWPTKLMIVSGVGMGLGVGALVTGLIMNVDATSEASATGKGLAYAGGALTGLSLTGLIIGVAGIASRPSTPNVIIQPQVVNEGGGVQVTGAIE